MAAGEGVGKSQYLVTCEKCTCGINQPYHFWLVARAMESHVSFANQSKGMASYPGSSLFLIQVSSHSRSGAQPP